MIQNDYGQIDADGEDSDDENDEHEELSRLACFIFDFQLLPL